jgi:hypothetical protein
MRHFFSRFLFPKYDTPPSTGNTLPDGYYFVKADKADWILQFLFRFLLLVLHTFQIGFIAPKNRYRLRRNRNPPFFSFSSTPPIRIRAPIESRGPDRVPDHQPVDQKNTPPRTPLKGIYNSLQFVRFLIFATNRGDNFRGEQMRPVFVFTTGP